MTAEDGGEASNKVSGGSFSGPVLQGRDFIDPTFVIQQAAAAPVALAQLPPLAAGFTGRGMRGRWWCRRWRGWLGWARRR